MTLKDQINSDIKEAMRARDTTKLTALRLITAAIKQVEVDERIIVDDDRILIILDKLAKQRNESIAQYKAAQRDDLVVKEQFELDILKGYLPEPLTDAEVETYIEEAIVETRAAKMADMGKLMARLKPQLQGRADMARVSAAVKAKLS